MHLRGLSVCLLALAASGCITIEDSETARDRQLAERQRTEAQREQMARLNEDVQSLQAEMQRMRAELDRLRVEQGRAGNAQIESLQQSMAALDRRIAAETADRERDRKIILDSVEKALRSGGGTRSSGASSTRSSGSSGGTSTKGYIHKIEAGQTLSDIASAYKTTPAIIIEANGLKNPNALRVGQELRIPAP